MEEHVVKRGIKRARVSNDSSNEDAHDISEMDMVEMDIHDNDMIISPLDQDETSQHQYQSQSSSIHAIESIDNETSNPNKQSITPSDNSTHHTSAAITEENVASSVKPQHTIRSEFALLPNVLFYEMCNYLSIDDKCLSMLVLCKSVRSMFQNNLSPCCKGWLSINLPCIDTKTHAGIDQTALKMVLTDKTVGRMKYVSTASHLSINYPGPHTKTSRLINHLEIQLMEAMSGGSVTSMYFNERCALLPFTGAENHSRAAAMSSSIGHLLVRSSDSELHIWTGIKELYLDLQDASKNNTGQAFALHARGLKSCTSLVAFKIAFPVSHLNIKSLEDVARSLPNCLEEFYVNSSLPRMSVFQISEEIFKSSNYLPHLRVYDPCWKNSPEESHDWYMEMSRSIFVTVQDVTSKVRPLQSAKFDGVTLTSEALENVNSLTSLGISDPSDSLATELSSCSINLLPNLRFLTLRCLDPHRAKLSPFLMMASQRPVESITLKNFACKEPLSDDAAKALSTLGSLRSLKIERASHFHMGFTWNSLSMISINAWPQLERLSLTGIVLGENSLTAILRAVPNCRHVELSNVYTEPGSGYVTELAMVLHFCPQVVDVHLTSPYLSVSNTRLSRQAFEKFPVHSLGLPNLVRVTLFSQSIVSSVLHCIVSHLKSAPRLAVFETPFLDQSLLSLCCLRRLTRLHLLPHFREKNSAKKNQQLILPVFKECVRHWRTSEFKSPMSTNWRIRDMNACVSPPETLAEFMCDTFGFDTTYLAFRDTLNADGLNGREECFDVVHAIMSREHKDQLKVWDEGNYSEKPAEAEAPIKTSRGSNKKAIHPLWPYYT